MSVCTLDEHRLAVYHKLAVLDAHVPESDLDGSGLSDTFLVGNRNFQIIQLRSLSSPQTWLLNYERVLNEITAVLIAECSCLGHRMVDLHHKRRIPRVSQLYIY